MPAAHLKKVYGLVAAKIGSDFAHKIGVPMPLEKPEFATRSPRSALKARTVIGNRSPLYEYGKSDIDGSTVAIRALPGATVMVQVQDLSRLEPELLAHGHWTCRHRECHGQKWDSKESLRRSHATHKDLVEAAERDVYGQQHTYYFVLEIAGTPEKRDEKNGKLIAEAVPPVIMLLSDEA